LIRRKSVYLAQYQRVSRVHVSRKYLAPSSGSRYGVSAYDGSPSCYRGGCNVKLRDAVIPDGSERCSGKRSSYDDFKKRVVRYRPYDKIRKLYVRPVGTGVKSGFRSYGQDWTPSRNGNRRNVVSGGLRKSTHFFPSFRLDGATYEIYRPTCDRADGFKEYSVCGVEVTRPCFAFRSSCVPYFHPYREIERLRVWNDEAVGVQKLMCRPYAAVDVKTYDHSAHPEPLS